jgi:hypothetical protein
MQRNTIISLVLVVLVIAGAWFFLAKRGDRTSSETVATVNGESISRADLDLTQVQVAAEQGSDFATLSEEVQAEVRTQALEVLISRKLIEQAVARSGISPTEAEIDEQFDAIKGQFENDAAFRSALSGEGMTERSLRTEIARDLAIQAYLASNLDLGSITVTEAEIVAAYNQAVGDSEDAPPLEEVRDQVEAMVRGQKEQVLVAQHIQELRAGAEVEILI